MPCMSMKKERGLTRLAAALAPAAAAMQTIGAPSSMNVSVICGEMRSNASRRGFGEQPAQSSSSSLQFSKPMAKSSVSRGVEYRNDASGESRIVEERRSKTDGTGKRRLHREGEHSVFILETEEEREKKNERIAAYDETLRMMQERLEDPGLDGDIYESYMQSAKDAEQNRIKALLDAYMKMNEDTIRIVREYNQAASESVKGEEAILCQQTKLETQMNAKEQMIADEEQRLREEKWRIAQNKHQKKLDDLKAEFDAVKARMEQCAEEMEKEKARVKQLRRDAVAAEKAARKGEVEGSLNRVYSVKHDEVRRDKDAKLEDFEAKKKALQDELERELERLEAQQIRLEEEQAREIDDAKKRVSANCDDKLDADLVRISHEANKQKEENVNKLKREIDALQDMYNEAARPEILDLSEKDLDEINQLRSARDVEVNTIKETILTNQEQLDRFREMQKALKSKAAKEIAAIQEMSKGVEMQLRASGFDIVDGENPGLVHIQRISKVGDGYELPRIGAQTAGLFDLTYDEGDLPTTMRRGSSLLSDGPKIPAGRRSIFSNASLSTNDNNRSTSASKSSLGGGNAPAAAAAGGKDGSKMSSTLSFSSSRTVPQKASRFDSGGNNNSGGSSSTSSLSGGKQQNSGGSSSRIRGSTLTSGSSNKVNYTQSVDKVETTTMQGGAFQKTRRGLKCTYSCVEDVHNGSVKYHETFRYFDGDNEISEREAEDLAKALNRSLTSFRNEARNTKDFRN